VKGKGGKTQVFTNRVNEALEADKVHYNFPDNKPISTSTKTFNEIGEDLVCFLSVMCLLYIFEIGINKWSIILAYLIVTTEETKEDQNEHTKEKVPNKFQTQALEAWDDNTHVILLQETKMSKEDEWKFKHAGIHGYFVVEVDNLNREERIAKRDCKRRESAQDLVRAPQDNVAGSEGLLIAVRRKGQHEPPVWETTFHKIHHIGS